MRGCAPDPVSGGVLDAGIAVRFALVHAVHGLKKHGGSSHHRGIDVRKSRIKRAPCVREQRFVARRFVGHEKFLTTQVRKGYSQM